MKVCELFTKIGKYMYYMANQHVVRRLELCVTKACDCFNLHI